MCGIIGIASNEPVANKILSGLKRLEYRGYDSAGISIKKNDLILHGHTHRFRLEEKEKCIIFNPGECAGFMKGKNQIGLIDLKVMNPKVINF